MRPPWPGRAPPRRSRRPARKSSTRATRSQDNTRFQAPSLGDDSSLGQGFEFDDDDNEGFFSNGGISQFQGGDSSGSTNQFNQQFGGRNRQFRGFSQQQPSFGGPVTRSRGS